MRPALELCPLCGASATNVKEAGVRFEDSPDDDAWRVWCVSDSCEYTGPYRRTENEAAVSWNRLAGVAP